MRHFFNRVNRALQGRRLYSCQVGTHAPTILPSAMNCKAAQTSSVFSEASWPESAVQRGGAGDGGDRVRQSCTAAALQPCISEVCVCVICSSRREQFVKSSARSGN